MRSILLVCTANICRSPTAEAVLRKVLADKGTGKTIEIDSAGTHDYQAGQPPSPMAVELARKRGYDITRRVARRVRSGDFDKFDMILAMDSANLSHLRAIAPTRSKQKIELFLEYGDAFHGLEIPDPFNGSERDYKRALDMIEDGCKGLAVLLASPTRRTHRDP